MRIWGWGLVLAGALTTASWGAGQALTYAAREALAARGSVAAAVAIGFPKRIGTRLSDVTQSDPASGLVWQAKGIDLSAPVWAPLDWRADLALPQSLSWTGNRFTLGGRAARLDAGFGLGLSVPLRKAAIALQQASLTAEAAHSPSLALQSLDLMLQSEGAPERYQLSGEIAALALPKGLAQMLAPKAALPDTIERLSLAATLAFDRPFGVLEPAAPLLTALDLGGAELLWDGHRIGVSGQLTVSEAGTPEGTLTIALTDWPVWLDLGIETGIFPPQRRPMLETMAAYLAKQSKDGSVQLPLSFANGAMSLAAIPLGPAPRLR